MTTDYTTKINERLSAAFGEVLGEVETLVRAALDEHAGDMCIVFLRERALTVALSLGISMDGAGRIEVELGTGYVKERVKDKRRVWVTPGQGRLPFVPNVVE